MSQASDLQKALLADMASKENLAQLQELSATFASMDENNDGLVDADEARKALAGKMPSAEIEKLISTLIGDKGKVAYTMFMGQLLAAVNGNAVDVLWKIFQDIDSDDNGYLDQSELRGMMDRDQVKAVFRGKTYQQVMKEYGWDRKVRVTWDDFRSAFEDTSTPESSRSRFKVDDDAEYYSTSYNQWAPTKVEAVRIDGSIQISIKPGYWMPLKDQLPGRIRLANEGTKTSPGQQLLGAAMGF